MKQLGLVLVLAISLISCEKSVLIPKESPGWNMDVTVQEGEDSSLAGGAIFCYPSDYKKIHDTTLYFNNYPDTGVSDEFSYYDTTTDLNHHGGNYFWYKIYVYDNKYFTYAGVDVAWIGPIYHRGYFNLLKIKRIYKKVV